MIDLSIYLPRDLLLDLYNNTTALAKHANKIIKEQTNLTGKNARGAEGQLRFRMLEQSFQKTCEQYGGVLIENGITINGTEHRVYQPFMRFTSNGKGIIFAYASMPAKRELPTKNQSRLNGVTLNYNVTPRLALDNHDPQPGDIFVLFLAARDTARAGYIEEVAIGIIDSCYESFAFYETMETFMARYAKPQESVAEPKKKLVKLKSKAKNFTPPEASEEKNDVSQEGNTQE